MQTLEPLNRKRAVYTGGKREKSVKRVSTRVPGALAAYITQLSTSRITDEAGNVFEYGNKVTMLSHLMHEFLEEKPWWLSPEKGGIKFYRGRAAKSTDPEVQAQLDSQRWQLFHVELQDLEGTTGKGLYKRLEDACSDANVSLSSFALTFLWWIAMSVHPMSARSPFAKELRQLDREIPKID